MNIKKIGLNVSKVSLTGISIWLSLQLGLGIILGYFTAKFLSGKQTGQQGKIKSLAFQMGNYKFHLHHWLFGLGALISILIFDLFYSQFFYGVLGGLVIQGIFNYKDWKKILTKIK